MAVRPTPIVTKFATGAPAPSTRPAPASARPLPQWAKALVADAVKNAVQEMERQRMAPIQEYLKTVLELRASLRTAKLSEREVAQKSRSYVERLAVQLKAESYEAMEAAIAKMERERAAAALVHGGK